MRPRTYINPAKALGELTRTANKTVTRLRGDRRPAILGDGIGNVYSGRSGYYRARFSLNTSDDGSVTYGAAFDVRYDGRVSLDPRLNLPVIVERVADGIDAWVIVSVNFSSATNAGYDPRQLNPIDPARDYVPFKNLVNGRVFVPSNDVNPLSAITVIPALMYRNGTFYDAQKGLSDNISLTSLVPTSGNERMAMAVLNSRTNVVRVIGSTTRSVGSGDAYTITDVATEFDAKVSNEEIPLAVFRLQDGNTDIRERDLIMDARQFIQQPEAAGFPYRLPQVYVIEDGYQQVIKGTLDLNEKTLVVEDGGVLIIEPETPTTNSKLITTDYSVKHTDDWIRADTSAFSITITLPSVSTGLYNNRLDITKITSAGSVTIDGNGANINGSTTQSLSEQYDSVTLRTDGIEWIVT